MSDKRRGGMPRGGRGRGGGGGENRNRDGNQSGGGSGAARYDREGQRNAGPSGYRGRDQRPNEGYRGQGRPNYGQNRGDRQQTRQDRGQWSRDQGDVPPLKFDVIEIAKQVKVKRVAENKQRGTEGMEVELITNHYPIQVKAVPCFQYDLSINIRKRVDNQLMPFKGPFNEKVRVINKMVEDWPEVFRSEDDIICFASDGAKNLFTKTKLDIEEKVSRDITMVLDGYMEQTFVVEIQFVAEVDLNHINIFYEGKDVEFSLTKVRDIHLQIYDIVTAHNQKLTHVSNGKSLFPTDTRSPNNPMIGFGHFQSVGMTESGLTLNVDLAVTAFRTGTQEKPLSEFAMDLNLSLSVKDQDVRNLSRKLKDLQIFTNHIKVDGRPQKRHHIIYQAFRETADSHIITMDSGERKTVAQYFMDTHDVEIRHLKDWPLIQIKGGQPSRPIYLPFEVCHVRPNQLMPRSFIDPDVQNLLTTSTNQMKPPERFSFIQEARNKIVDQDVGNLISQFGLTIGENPIKVKGRKLDQPKVRGNTRKLETAGELNNYLFFNLSYRVNNQYLENNFKSFFYQGENNLVGTANSMGLKMKNKPMDDIDLIKRQDFRDPAVAFERELKAAKEKFGDSIEMIFVVIPNDNDLYDSVKFMADIGYGFLTQCINENKFTRPKRGYFNNLVLKINAKLDGRNQVLDVHNLLPILSPKLNTMIIGADVCHPGYKNQLANERVISSIAAVVGTYDKEFSKFAVNVSAQPAGTEFIENFDTMLIKLLEHFKAKNNCLPENIILFRDGVSDGQLDSVKNGEIPLIEKAFDKLSKGFKPKITAYVVQKRHHTRFMFADPNNKFLNIASGTVIDNTITSPLYEEFYLASHNSPLGTSRPAKYVVLRNDHKLSADEKQKLAYYMCFAFCRCPTPISIPIPTKYADLAAYRAKQYANQMERDGNIVFEERRNGETEDEKRDRERRNIEVLNEAIQVFPNFVSTLFYI